MASSVDGSGEKEQDIADERINEAGELGFDGLESVGGGVIVNDNGRFWVVTDDVRMYNTTPYDDIASAEARASQLGVSTKVYTREEFTKAFGEYHTFLAE